MNTYSTLPSLSYLTLPSLTLLTSRQVKSDPTKKEKKKKKSQAKPRRLYCGVRNTPNKNKTKTKTKQNSVRCVLSR